MENGKIEQKDITTKKSSKAKVAIRVAAAAGILAGGAAGTVLKNNTDASTSGGNSWGARTEQSHQINPTETPEAAIIETTPTPTSVPTIGEPWSATPSPESPNPTPSPIIGDAWVSPPSAPESPTQLPQTGGPVSGNHRSGITDKLAPIAGAVLSGFGILVAKKQRSSQR